MGDGSTTPDGGEGGGGKGSWDDIPMTILPPLLQQPPSRRLPPISDSPKPPLHRQINGAHQRQNGALDGPLPVHGGRLSKTSLGVKIGGSDEDLEDNNDFKRETRVVPPDGGWGWVVVLASFFCNVMVDGIIFTAGMLLPSIMEEFEVSYSEVSWVSSLLGGFYLLAGPFVSSLANAYGFRTVCIIGSVVSCIACGISYFATSIYYLYASYGILAGIGFGFIYVPAVIATGFYFEKRRALATGIAVCGSGIGTFTLSPLNNYLLGTVGWRGTLLVNAGLILTCIIFSLAFRPLSAATGKVVAVDEDPVNELPLLLRIKRERDAQLKACMSDYSLQSANFNTIPPKVMAEFMNKPAAKNPNIARLMQEERQPKRNSFAGVGSVRGNSIASDDVGGKSNVSQPESGQLSPREEGEFNVTPRSMTSDHLRLDDNKNETLLTVPGKNIVTVVRNSGCTRNESAPVLNRVTRRPSDFYNRRSSRVSLKSESARPFYRDDVFYSGSLVRLPQYTSSESVEQYHASVTHIPREVIHEIVEEMEGEDEGGCCKACPTAAKAVLTKMFDFSLCTSPTFLVVAFAGFLSLLSLFVPFTFLPSFISSQKEILGLSDVEADQTKAFLMSLIGICNTIGRVVCGWVSDHPRVDAILVNNVGLLVGGVATCCIPFISNVSLLYLYGVMFGFSIAIFASLRSILLVELLGLERLTNAFGLLLLVQGIAAVFGSPIAGAFADATGGFNVSFYVFGAAYGLSGLLCIPIRRIKAWETNKEEQKMNTISP